MKVQKQSSAKPRVIIVGGGFAGISTAKILGEHPELEVTLIDRRNHHLFQPLLYQVAMAGLSPAEIAVPIRGVLSRFSNTEVLLAEVQAIDFENKTLTTDIGPKSYDFLVLACGAWHSYIGREDWESFAPGLKTLEQATEIRRRVLLAFERAETSSDKTEQKAFLTFVIVGGGPTGVELAGALGEISRFTLVKDFRRIDSNRTRIVLVEAGERILSSFDPELSRKAARDLEKLGVQIWTSSRVTDITKEGIYIGQEFLQAKTVLWAAGVQAAPISHLLAVELDPQKRIFVNPDLSIPGFASAFAVGDLAHFARAGGKPLPGLAPVAMQQGRWVAANILSSLRGQPTRPFQYLDKGQLATIGRKKAVLEKGKLTMHGNVAWLAWLFVHVYYLIGFRNRLMVLMEWAWSYFFYKRGARLIVDKEWRMF